MKNSIKKVLLGMLLATAAISAHATSTTASWTNWSGTSGTFVQNSNTINVTYTGQSSWVDHSAYIYDVPSSFTAPSITNTPGTNGTIAMVGGGSSWGNFHFSQPVTNPVLDLFSVGQTGVPVRFVFNTTAFSILSQGTGHWAGGSLTQTGNTVLGREGNGLLQFVGSYTDISFSLPDYEYYYGATVGAPTETPIPAAMWLFGSGLAGLIAAKRKKNTV